MLVLEAENSTRKMGIYLCEILDISWQVNVLYSTRDYALESLTIILLWRCEVRLSHSYGCLALWSSQCYQFLVGVQYRWYLESVLLQMSWCCFYYFWLSAPLVEGDSSIGVAGCILFLLFLSRLSSWLYLLFCWYFCLPQEWLLLWILFLLSIRLAMFFDDTIS